MSSPTVSGSIPHVTSWSLAPRSSPHRCHLPLLDPLRLTRAMLRRQHRAEKPNKQITITLSCYPGILYLLERSLYNIIHRKASYTFQKRRRNSSSTYTSWNVVRRESRAHQSKNMSLTQKSTKRPEHMHIHSKKKNLIEHSLNRVTSREKQVNRTGSRATTRNTLKRSVRCARYTASRLANHSVMRRRPSCETSHQHFTTSHACRQVGYNIVEPRRVRE
jgi:hypothetical protein